MIFYTNKLVKKGFAGTTIGPFIFIRPKYRDDKGLAAHEKSHARLFWQTLGLMLVLYPLVRPFRYWAELRAYRTQLRFVAIARRPKVARKFAQFLATKYRLRIAEDSAYRDLLK